MSDPYAHKYCRTLEIKSRTKHYKYKKPGSPFKIYPNLLLAEMQIDRPLQCVISDMIVFYVKNIYYELMLYMEQRNSKTSSHALLAKRGNRMTYISDLEYLIDIKKQHSQYEMNLQSMSRAEMPTAHAVMEYING